MSRLAVTVAIVGVIACVALFAVYSDKSVSLFQVDNWEVEQKFIRFMGQHQRLYGSVDEYKFRLGVFTEALNKIDEMNAASNGNEIFGINILADWTEEEF